jgi:hypothetical protein
MKQKSHFGQEESVEYFLHSSHPIRIIIVDVDKRRRCFGRFCEFQ